VHLVTQDPRYIDVHLRRLCNGHIHYWRVFKSQQLLRFESEAVIEKVETKTSFKDADKKSIRLDKRYFSVYTSSNANHHFQAKLPMKFIMAMVVIAVMLVWGYRFIEKYSTGADSVDSGPEGAASDVVGQVKSTVGSFIGTSQSGSSGDAPLTVEAYLHKRVPRVPHIPASAPIYDTLTQPVAYPRLYCMSSSDPDVYARSFNRMASAVVNGKPTVCQCYTQQGTRIATDFAFCNQIVENGYFDSSVPDRGQHSQALQQQLPKQPVQTYQSKSADKPPSTAVTVVPYEKGQFLW